MFKNYQIHVAFTCCMPKFVMIVGFRFGVSFNYITFNLITFHVSRYNNLRLESQIKSYGERWEFS